MVIEGLGDLTLARLSCLLFWVVLTEGDSSSSAGITAV